MSMRSIIVRLEAEVGGYVAGLGRAAVATDNLAKQAAQARNTITQNSAAMESVGKSAMLLGAGTLAGLGLATKAASDWESAWAGVTKTVDGSPEQMKALEGGLRDLATTLPITHKEIAGVAEAAGQLGVKREDILGFTKTMIDLGVSTNLTAEDAATQIAQIANVTGLLKNEGAEGVARFGATLVALGNAGASTEADILAMSQRIAGAGATVGATDGEILALANTLSSMGIKAELGGGVTTRVLLKMFDAVQSGGPKMEAFAKTAGMSASEFATAFGDSPVEAMGLVTAGLDRINQEGGNVVGTMKDMGIKGTEEIQVMLALANSGSLLGDSLDLQAEAWQANTALLDEAGKRYATTESKVKIALNGINDAAIDLGSSMLPVVQSVAEGAAALARAFGDIPGPLQAFIAIAALAVGGTALLGGAALTTIPKIVALQAALKTLNASGSAVPGMFSKVAKSIGLLGIAAVAAVGIVALNNSMQPGKKSAEEYAASLEGLAKNADSIDDAFADIKFGDGDILKGQIDGVGDALAQLTSKDIGKWAAGLGASMGVDNGMARLRQGIEDTDYALKAAVDSGAMDKASEGFRAIAKSAEAQGVSLDEVMSKFPAYEAALTAKAAAAGVDLEATDLLAYAMGELPPALAEAEAAAAKESGAVGQSAEAAEAAAQMTKELAKRLEELGVEADGTVANLTNFTNALVNAGLLTLGTRDSARQYQASIDALNQSLIDNGTTMDINTEAGRNNQAALDGIASSGMAYAQALASETDQLGRVVNSQDQVSAALQQTYTDYIASAEGMGLSTEAATALAREVMGIPAGVSIETFMADTAKMMAEGTTGSIMAIPDIKIIDSWMSAAAKETADATKKSADDIPEQETVDTWMSDAAFIEAIRTRAAAEGIPEKEAIQSFMDSAARNEADRTTAQVLGIPRGASVTSFMSAYARQEAQNLKAVLDSQDGRHISTSATHTNTTVNRVVNTEEGAAMKPGQIGMTRAGGGAVYGPGSGTTDEAGEFRLSNGEHVLTAREVALAGGQSAIYDWRARLRSGDAAAVRGKATGGGVGPRATSFPVTSYRAGSGGVQYVTEHNQTVKVGEVRDVRELSRVMERSAAEASVMARLQQSERRST